MGGWLWWCGIRGEGWKGGWLGHGLGEGMEEGGREKRDGGLGLVLGVHDLVGEEERGSRFLVKFSGV
ncbi:uncharacterized protein G2W53_007870 [Senna tora]|uniref:Uncharacterized protein n=1 Tax=Senna tora TaxID=362788 RepID=A0A834X7F9_9FABA|nr:uncharacterized protein G2W53_007870 [Senna tora]